MPVRRVNGKENSDTLWFQAWVFGKTGTLAKSSRTRDAAVWREGGVGNEIISTLLTILGHSPFTAQLYWKGGKSLSPAWHHLIHCSSYCGCRTNHQKMQQCKIPIYYARGCCGSGTQTGPGRDRAFLLHEVWVSAGRLEGWRLRAVWGLAYSYVWRLGLAVSLGP